LKENALDLYEKGVLSKVQGVTGGAPLDVRKSIWYFIIGLSINGFFIHCLKI